MSAFLLIITELLVFFSGHQLCVYSLPPTLQPIPSPNPACTLHSTQQTNLSLWGFKFPLGQRAVGVGTGSFTVMNSTETAVQIHHGKNCSHGSLIVVKTNKSKYLELIQKLFGFSLHLWPLPLPQSIAPQDCYLSISTFLIKSFFVFFLHCKRSFLRK